MTVKRISNPARSPRIESIEPRTLLAATLTNGVLTVTGNERAEHIEVDLNEGRTNIEVNVERLGGNGGDDIDPTQIFTAADVSRIVVNSLAGNDDIAVDEDITLPTDIRGGDGDDTISGDSGNDYINGGGGEDRLLGNGGNDILTGGSSKNYLYGGDGDDRLNGSASHDFLRGEAGDDRIHGGAGDDELDGGGNRDRLYGDSGNDLLFGGTAIDRLYGGDGDDSLFGGKADDYLFGDEGNDSGQDLDDDVLESVEDKSL